MRFISASSFFVSFFALTGFSSAFFVVFFALTGLSFTFLVFLALVDLASRIFVFFFRASISALIFDASAIKLSFFFAIKSPVF